MRSVVWAMVLAAAAFLSVPEAGAQSSTDGVAVVIPSPPELVAPLGGSVTFVVQVTTQCVDEDLQPMTQTQVGITWNRPSPYVTVNGSQVQDSHAKDSLACASGSDDVTSTLAFTANVAPDAPGFEPFDVAVTAVMNKTTMTGATTQYGPATGTLTLYTGFRSGLHVVEIAGDPAVKPGNETTLRLRVFNLANAEARVTIAEAPAPNGNTSTMRVMTLPEPFTLAAAGNTSDHSRRDVAIRLEAPPEVPAPGYHPATVTLRFTTETEAPDGTSDTESVEQTFTRHVGGQKVDVYSPTPPLLAIAALVAAAVAAKERRN